MLETIIKDINLENLEAIKSILDLQLGFDYITMPQLNLVLESSFKNGYVSETNDEISGVVLTKYFENWADLTPFILDEKDWFKSYFSSSYPIGILDVIAVHPNFSGLGIGSKLVDKIDLELSKKCQNTIAFVWQHPNGTPLAKILEHKNYSHIKTAKTYWIKDSISKGYHCKYCGQPPCQCFALIYEKVY